MSSKRPQGTDITKDATDAAAADAAGTPAQTSAAGAKPAGEVSTDQSSSAGGQQQDSEGSQDKSGDGGEKLSTVTLKEPHTHDGVQYPAGASIKVNAADEQWLRKQQII